MEHDIEKIKASLIRIRLILILNMIVTLVCVGSVLVLIRKDKKSGYAETSSVEKGLQRDSELQSAKDNVNEALDSSSKNQTDDKETEEQAETPTEKTGTEEDYLSTVLDTMDLILQNCALSEETGNLILRVWYNSIYHQKSDLTDPYTRRQGEIPEMYKDFPELYDDFYDDFIDALDNLYSDPEYQEKNDEINSNRQRIDECMSKLKNPPKKYKSLYQDLRAYYDAYVEFANVFNKSGSYNELSREFHERNEKLLDCFNKLQTYFE